MQVEMKVHHHGWRASSALVAVNGEVKAGRQVPIPNSDATIAYDGGLMMKSWGVPEVSGFIITFGSGVASGVVANYIFQKLFPHKDSLVKIEINRKMINFEEGEIKRAIEEQIKIERE